MALLVPSEKITPKFIPFMSFSNSRNCFPANCTLFTVVIKGVMAISPSRKGGQTWRPVREMKRRRMSLLPSNILKILRSLSTLSRPQSCEHHNIIDMSDWTGMCSAHTVMNPMPPYNCMQSSTTAHAASCTITPHITIFLLSLHSLLTYRCKDFTNGRL